MFILCQNSLIFLSFFFFLMEVSKNSISGACLANSSKTVEILSQMLFSECKYVFFLNCQFDCGVPNCKLAAKFQSAN